MSTTDHKKQQDGFLAKAQLDIGARCLDLETRLAKKGILANEDAKNKKDRDQIDKSSIAQALKLSSEFLAAIVVGVCLGLGFDQITGFSPWGLVVFLFLGFAAGILNILKATGQVASRGFEYRYGNKEISSDDDRSL